MLFSWHTAAHTHANLLILTNITGRESGRSVESQGLLGRVVVVVDMDVGWGRIRDFKNAGGCELDASRDGVERTEENVEPRVSVFKVVPLDPVHFINWSHVVVSVKCEARGQVDFHHGHIAVVLLPVNLCVESAELELHCCGLGS